MDEAWIEVGVIGRPHGIRGAVNVHLHNPDSSLLQPSLELYALDARAQVPGKPPVSGEGMPTDQLAVTSCVALVIEWIKQSSRGWIVKWLGVDQREVGAALTNRRLFVKRSQLPGLEADEVYQADLLGLSVNDLDGRRLGTIVGFFDNGAHEVCVVETAQQREVLLPFDEKFIEDICLTSGVVIMDVPAGIPGLEELE